MLKKLEDRYPIAEFTICMGMLIVMTAERFASLIQAKKAEEKQNCDASKDCCKVRCKKGGQFFIYFFFFSIFTYLFVVNLLLFSVTFSLRNKLTN